MPFLFTSSKLDMEERKQVTEELLPHVFNANPHGIESFFNKAENASQLNLVLVKASYREGYLSKKEVFVPHPNREGYLLFKELNQFICLRRWRGVSPLQAAYLCGDGPFLGRQLLNYITAETINISKRKKFVKEALQQLKELLQRSNTSASPVDNKFADAAEFLAPLKELSRAYHVYISQYGSSEKKLIVKGNLFGDIGKCQRKLPRYVLQEFSSATPFHPLPSFNNAPHRNECRYINGNLLNLDELGTNAYPDHGFYKGYEKGGIYGGYTGTPTTKAAPVDLAAIDHLYKLREDNLRNTIHYLELLESKLEHTIDKKIIGFKF